MNLVPGSILAGILVCAASAQAGQITMKNGDRISGEIKQIWDGKVFIDPPYGDEFSVEQSEIAAMEDDREFELELRGGQDLTGSLAGSDSSGNQLIVIDGVEQPVAINDLAELEEPEVYEDWFAQVDLNTAINKGNTDSENYKFSGAMMYKLDKQRHFFDFLFADESQNGVQVKDRELFRYNLNYQVQEPWFFGTGASYESDPIKRLDHRYNIVPAIGYDFWNDAGRLFNIQLGAGYQSEKTELTDSDGAVAAFLLRFRYDFPSPDLQIYLNNATTRAYYGRENTVTQFVTGVRYEITDLLYANFELDIDYETEPVPGAENEDIALLFGIGVALEK